MIQRAELCDLLGSCFIHLFQQLLRCHVPTGCKLGDGVQAQAYGVFTAIDGIGIFGLRNVVSFHFCSLSPLAPWGLGLFDFYGYIVHHLCVQNNRQSDQIIAIYFEWFVMVAEVEWK
nr:MAG TPA: hypothetical protein [Caudoviricetes sp.]